MRKFYVIGNLKMNMLSREEAAQYLSVLRREVQGKRYEHVTGAVCPPFLYLSQFDHLPEGIKKGAQNLFPEKSGAYTGEISPVMLKNDGVEYVIIGHSERRQHAGETNEMIREKIVAALKHHLIPIVCIGEMAAERRAEETDRILALQIQTIFAGLSKSQAEKIIVAYEPCWAIGTDVLPTTGELLQVRVMLRKMFTEMFDAQTAERIAVLYGGSVKSSFLAEVSWEAQMDGVLVGHESLFPYELVKMMGLCEEEALRQNEQSSSRIG
ncbi:MAG: triose-phosphate isomerase [Candidatus Moranbacteria bacterium RIFCSPHIGHO2_01_FULL_54_31]|nr:MAG: triose-phosphate isomerase [Candidatus Moranbacteria bacterium RIFCSPHIGHO2_01_FULL_54_31]